MAKLKKRKDGMYQKSVLLSTGKRKVVYAKTLAELQAKEDIVKSEDKSGLDIGDHTLVGEWAKQWLKVYKSGLRQGTYEMYRRVYNNNIMELLGAMELRDVKPVHIKKVMLSVADKSESWQDKVLLTMRQMFRTARQNHLIIDDPTEGIKITKQSKATVQKEMALSDEQQHQLLNHFPLGSQEHTFCALGLFAGLRREEIYGLQWGDITDKDITVNRSVTFLKDGSPDPNQSLKSKAAHRVIPLMSELADVLQAAPRTGLYVLTAPGGGSYTRKEDNHVCVICSAPLKYVQLPICCGIHLQRLCIMRELTCAMQNICWDMSLLASLQISTPVLALLTWASLRMPSATIFQKSLVKN